MLVPLPARFRSEGAPGDGRLRAFLLNAAFVGMLAAVYMGVSTGLITFNKYLMHADRFPYAAFIGIVHMSCSSAFNVLLYHACPALYPSLVDPAQRVFVDRGLVLRVLFPIAGCFAAQLVLSNMAFLHSSIAFLQMMKQSNVVLVYLFSLALALQTFAWKRGLALLFIAAATALTIHGEMHFSSRGFTIQAVSMVCESFKLTLQSYSLSATGRRLDALTYVMLVAPLVLLALVVLLLALHFLWPGCPEALTLPPWELIIEFRWLLLGNGCLAFAMNVSHALFVKSSSAITFILTGVLLKDVLIVVVGSFLEGELLSRLQAAGFAMQLIGVLIWSQMKTPGPSEAAVSANPKLSKVAPECEALWSKAPGPTVHISSKVSDRSLASSTSTAVPHDDDSDSLTSSAMGPCLDRSALLSEEAMGPCLDRSALLSEAAGPCLDTSALLCEVPGTCMARGSSLSEEASSTSANGMLDNDTDSARPVWVRQT